MVKTSTQVIILFKKNAKLIIRGKEYIRDSIFPIVVASMTIFSACSSQNTQTTLAPYLGIMGPLAIVPFLRNFLQLFVEEKQLRVKETYKIMGMKQISYTISWYLTNTVKGLFIISIIVIPSLASGFYNTMEGGAGNAILLEILYLFAQMNFCFMMSTFFNRPQIGSEVYMLTQVLTTFLFSLGSIQSVNQIQAFWYFLGLFPQSALNMGYSVGGGQSSFGFTMNNDITIVEIYLMLIGDSFLYFLLYLYFDEVIPNELGTQKPIFFPCMCKNKKQKQQTDIQKPLLKIQDESFQQTEQDTIIQEEQTENKIEKDFSSAKFHQEFKNPKKLKQVVKINDLKKDYEGFYAVDGISLCLYEEQIFCLLGHNGCGKTTTISMLCGMITKSEGQIQIGNEIMTDLNVDELRNGMGICGQKDVLFGLMTVEEHLYFLADLKGLPKEIAQQRVEHVIQKTTLTNERKKYVDNLSGGNKRKVSLAMALLGGEKVLFLDEPSSGMDPNSRRLIWDILKEVKSEKRTVILTTHHLEEAEELAERIGVMGKGKLLTVGTCDFIKKKFGIGYHLKIRYLQKGLNLEQQNEIGQIEHIPENKRQEIIQTINDRIEGAKFNPQSSKDSVVFTVPFYEKPKFSALFQYLEQDPQIVVNLELNTLEDAFVNIGMEEQSLLEDENQEVQQKQAKYTNFEDIIPPKITEQPPRYNFFIQVQAMYMRKFYFAKRTNVVLFGFFMPLFLATFACILVSNLSIPYVANPDKRKASQFYAESFTLGIYLAMAYGFSNSSYCATIVQEKEYKLKYALHVMGCRVSTFWVGTFLFDYTMYLVVQIFYFLIIWAFDLKIIFDNLAINIALMASFGIGFICVSYVVSFLFKSSLTAQKFGFVINFVVMFIVFVSIGQVSGIKILNSILYTISPFYALYWSIVSLGFQELNYQQQQVEIFKDLADIMYLKQPYEYIILFIIQGIFYFSLAILLDIKTNILTDKNTINTNDEAQGQNLEQEVLEEEKIVDSQNCNSIVQVSHLYKKYDNGYLAIKNNSFRVEQGEILGLLGPNGAGKSTTFNILTSFFPSTSGKVVLKETEIKQGIMDIYQYVGICPQFDGLWMNLTVKEHLMMFGKMKGLSGKDLQDAIEYFVNVMQLSIYLNVQSYKLSGGNKRKLCVTMALIGGPDMQFFDEPSSGVDPVARRFLWNTMTNSLKLRNNSLVLTTHSMHEAENLCNRIGILVNGRFQCMGTPDKLKQKYGEGYFIDIETQNNLQTITNLIKEEFPNCEIDENQLKEDFQDDQHIQIDMHHSDLKEHHMKELVVKLPYQGFSFSKTFRFFQEELQQKGIISDFTVKQCTLEEVFLQFSKMQQVLQENINFSEK